MVVVIVRRASGSILSCDDDMETTVVIVPLRGALSRRRGHKVLALAVIFNDVCLNIYTYLFYCTLDVVGRGSEVKLGVPI